MAHTKKTNPRSVCEYAAVCAQAVFYGVTLLGAPVRAVLWIAFALGCGAFMAVLGRAFGARFVYKKGEGAQNQTCSAPKRCTAFLALAVHARLLFGFAIGIIVGFYAIGVYTERTLPLKSLLEPESITALYGTVTGAPVRTVSGDYRVSFCVNEVKNDAYSGSAIGTVCVYIPSAIAEKCYPGRLSSLSKDFDAKVIDLGARLWVRGSFSHNKEDVFYGTAATHNGFENGVFEVRAKVRNFLRNLTYAWGEAGGLMFALVSGSREYLADELVYTFNEAGLSHVLALSGMHLSVLGSFVVFCTLFCCGKRWAAVLMGMVCALFVWFAGSSPSLVRALFMMCLVFISEIAGVRVNVRAAVACAFIVQLCFASETALSASFLLSYSATFGLVFALDVWNRYGAHFWDVCTTENACYNGAPVDASVNGDASSKPAPVEASCSPAPLLSTEMHRAHNEASFHFDASGAVKRLYTSVGSALFASTGAVVFSLPFTALLFGRVTFIGIVSSVFAVPLVTLFFILGIFAILFGVAFPQSVLFFSPLLTVVYRALCAVVAFFA